MKTLRDWLPREALSYDPAVSTNRFLRYLGVEVVEECGYLSGNPIPWPGREKNVHFWWTLKDGHRVGFNESPSRGWSFTVLGRTMTPPHPGKSCCIGADWELVANVYRCAQCGTEYGSKI